MENGSIRTSKSVQIIREDGKYFRLEHNQYLDSNSIKEIVFDENGVCKLRDGQCITTYKKDKIDILFKYADHN